MASTINANTSGGLISTADTSGILALQTAGTTAVTIDASQNVGVGTTSPVSKLQVGGTSDVGISMSNSSSVTSGNRGTISMYNSSTSTVGYLRFGADTDNVGTNIQFGVRPVAGSATEAMRITSTGNVGIGTSSPSAKLEIVSGAGTTNKIALTGSTTAAAYTQYGNSAGNFYIGRDNSTGGNFGTAYAVALYAEGAYPMTFFTTGTERMRIKSDGILVTGGATSEGGIDVGNAVNPGVAIYGTTSAKGIITVQNNTDSNMYMSKASGYSSGIYVKFYVNSSQVGKIETNGSTTSYVTTSDYRLKEDIAPLSGALDTVALLKPVTYKWKTTGDAGQGFIAHELQAVVPDCVSGEKDAVDADGNIKPQGIDTSFLVATLTAAIQEQQALITQLQADVAALKAK